MLTGIDHLVVVVADLDAAVKDYTELGFTVVRGGRHPGGTHNALVAFADGAYLELLAFYEAAPGHRWSPTLQRGGGLVDFCMATNNLQADMDALRRAGVRMSDLLPGARQRPDGYSVRWVLSVPRDEFSRAAPFLIQDETPRDERVPGQREHRNHVTGVASITVATGDPAAAQRWFTGMLQHPGEAIVRDDLDATGVRFTVGPHVLDYVSPRGSAGPLSDWLRIEGPSLLAVTLKTTAGKAGPLDAKKLGRARFAVA